MIFYGKIMRPPYKIRQEAGKVYVNETEVYPFKTGKPSFVHMPEGDEPPDLDFELDETTKRVIEEGLSKIRDIDRYEEKSEELTKFLKGKGVNAYRDENFGDVMVDTGKGWGVMALFNEDARIALAKEAEILVTERRIPYDDAAQISTNLQTALDEGDLVIFDEGSMMARSGDEAVRARSALEKVVRTDASKDNKISEIASILGITTVSAERVLEEFKGY